MVYKKLIKIAIRKNPVVLLAGGVAAVTIGNKLLESDIVKDTTTRAMAEVMAIKSDAEDIVEQKKADSQEIIVEAKK